MFISCFCLQRSAVFFFFHKCAKAWQVKANGLWRHGVGGDHWASDIPSANKRTDHSYSLWETATKAKISGLGKNKMLAKSFDELKTTLS